MTNAGTPAVYVGCSRAVGVGGTPSLDPIDREDRDEAREQEPEGSTHQKRRAARR